MKTKVHRVVLCVVDHDQLGADGVREVLENARYPNRCIAPTVASVETRAVDWTDRHPLNMRDTSASAFAAMFPGAPLVTPDEARRLVGEFAGAHGAMVAHLAGMPGPESGEDVAARAESARAAILRALGVEA